MKGALAFFSLGFFALANLVGASPVAVPSNELVKRGDDGGSLIDVDVDIIIGTLVEDVLVINKNYNEVCKDSCTTDHVKSWAKEVSDKCYVAIDKCGKLPKGHKFLGVEIIAALVVKLLVSINVTLKFLLSQCGLLGLLVSIVHLVAVLIAALNSLLACLVLLVDGLLALVAKLLLEALGLLGCLICDLGVLLK